MKFTIPTTQEIDITHVSILCAVNYDEEEIPNDFPGRDGDMWGAIINIDTGTILDWSKGRAEKMHLTVKDCGTYKLLAFDGREVLKREDNYVPHGVIPGKYGDTIELDISADGVIRNWPKKISIDQFISDEE